MWKSTRIALLILIYTSAGWALPLGTEFRYTGFLTKNNSGVNGDYDFEATLCDAVQNGNNLATVTLTKVPVVNGVFQLLIDFGAKFDGTKLWLQLRVQQNGQQNQWQMMSPRQLLTATPYALFAPTAGSANNIANNSVTTLSIQNGSVTAPKIGNGEVVKSLNGLHDSVSLTAGANITITPQGNNLQISASGGGGGNAWSLAGNSGTTPALNFLGTLDNQALEMHVNALRGFRIEPAYADYFPLVAFDDAINVIGGYRDNRVQSGVVGGTISGGGYLHGSGLSGSGSDYPNIVIGNFGTIGGGYSNRADFAAAIAGGHHNAASRFGFIGAGELNTLVLDHSFYGVIGGGSHNWVGPDVGLDRREDVMHATVGGGYYNEVAADYATIPGGYNNLAGGRFSFAAGRDASTRYDGSFVWNDSTGTGFSPSGDNQFAVRATGGVRLSEDSELYFGARARQMIHLWGDTDGIGVQNRTIYFRTGGQSGRSPDADGFAWYAGGSHVDPSDDPGPGGLKLMSLRYDTSRWGNCGGPIPTDLFLQPGAILRVEGELDVRDNIYLGGCVHDGSDRNSKENFAEISCAEVFEKVVNLPITRWNYKKDKRSLHIGPMAQDFYAAFNVGPDEKHISNIDEGGVALAAIQGLNQKLEEEVRSKDAEIQALKENVNEMRQLLNQLAAQMKGGAQ